MDKLNSMQFLRKAYFLIVSTGVFEIHMSGVCIFSELTLFFGNFFSTTIFWEYLRKILFRYQCNNIKFSVCYNTLNFYVKHFWKIFQVKFSSLKMFVIFKCSLNYFKESYAIVWFLVFAPVPTLVDWSASSLSLLYLISHNAHWHTYM